MNSFFDPCSNQMMVQVWSDRVTTYDCVLKEKGNFKFENKLFFREMLKPDEFTTLQLGSATVMQSCWTVFVKAKYAKDSLDHFCPINGKPMNLNPIGLMLNYDLKIGRTIALVVW